MKKALPIVFLVLLIVMGWQLFKPRSCGAACLEQFKSVSPSEFQQLAQSSEVVILDVRTAEEFAAGHLDKAVQSDFYQAPQFSSYLDSLDKNKTYLVYCRSGNRSSQAAEIMKAKGFSQVIDLTGGIQAWQAAGLPIKQ